jgi:hypothetical protein
LTSSMVSFNSGMNSPAHKTANAYSPVKEKYNGLFSRKDSLKGRP